MAESNDLKVESRRMDAGEYVAEIVVTGDKAKVRGSYYIYIDGPNFSDVDIVPY